MNQNILTYDRNVKCEVKSKRNGKNKYLFIKRIFDILLSSISLVFFSPTFLLLTLLIPLIDKVAPYYVTNRIGKNGKVIKMIKFRTMVPDADNLNSYFSNEELEKFKINYKLENDKRITMLGKYLRKTSLDELPQLINVFIGEMSIVGPRPIIKNETSKYGDDLRILLSIKPGLTGYWQAYGRNNISYLDGKRQSMELFYVRNCNFVLDIKIFFKTFSAVITQRGAC